MPLLRLPLFRLLAINLAIGIAAAVLMLFGLVALNPHGLRDLMLADPAGAVAAGLLLFGLVITFGSVAMGTAIMALGAGEGGGGKGKAVGAIGSPVLRDWRQSHHRPIIDVQSAHAGHFGGYPMRKFVALVLMLAATAFVADTARAETKPKNAVKLTRGQVDDVCGKGGSCYLMECGQGHHCNYSCNGSDCWGTCIDCGVKQIKSGGKRFRNIVIKGVAKAQISGGPKPSKPPGGLLGQPSRAHSATGLRHSGPAATVTPKRLAPVAPAATTKPVLR
jgi:hypothetical protein